jgi:hypothetical protein
LYMVAGRFNTLFRNVIFIIFGENIYKNQYTK